MPDFSKAKKIVAKAVKEAVGRHISYDRETRVLKIGHGLVSLAARRALKSAEEIQEVDVAVEEGAYRLLLTADRDIRVRIRMIPAQIELKEDRVVIVIRLPDGIRYDHENAVVGYLARFVDRVFGIFAGKMAGIDNIDYDGKKTLTYTRRLEDFPLARIYRISVGQKKALPLKIGADHLQMDLSSMFAEGEKIDAKDLVVPPNADR